MNHSAAVAQYSTVEAAKQQHVVVVVVVVVVVATAAVSVTAVVEPKFLHRSEDPSPRRTGKQSCYSPFH